MNSYYSYYNYNISTTKLEYFKIKLYIFNIESIITQNQNHYNRELETNLNIMNFNFEKLKNKNNNIYPHYDRLKRGLINGLGNIIKQLTVNLDSSDGERYEELFKKINQNQQKLQTQNLETIHLNKEMIKKFNDQLENIKHNEVTLKSKISQLTSIINKTQKEMNVTNKAKK